MNVNANRSGSQVLGGAFGFSGGSKFGGIFINAFNAGCDEVSTDFMNIRPFATLGVDRPLWVAAMANVSSCDMMLRLNGDDDSVIFSERSLSRPSHLASFNRVRRTRDETVCILAWQLPRVAAMTYTFCFFDALPF
ncbi:hypothetical protein Tco_1439839 [Tanacetum coccineum]